MPIVKHSPMKGQPETLEETPPWEETPNEFHLVRSCSSDTDSTIGQVIVELLCPMVTREGFPCRLFKESDIRKPYVSLCTSHAWPHGLHTLYSRDTGRN